MSRRSRSIPTADHIDVAVDMISEVIADFPFVDESSRVNAIASMLTPVCRPAIKGPTPLALYDATTQGTGKTLLSEVVSLITSGREGALFSAPRDAEEWRKQLTSVLREGSTVVVIDNVNYRLDSGDLCKALTETTHGDRILGQSQTLNLPVRCAWIVTGNNIQLGGDMPRRCYWIRMDAKCSKPFQRTGFKHKRLKEYVLKHRGELLAALLTLARAWFVAGRPEPKRHARRQLRGLVRDYRRHPPARRHRRVPGELRPVVRAGRHRHRAVGGVPQDARHGVLQRAVHCFPSVGADERPHLERDHQAEPDCPTAPRDCGRRCRTSSRRPWTARGSSSSALASRWANVSAAATAIPRCGSSATFTTAMARWRAGRWC